MEFKTKYEQLRDLIEKDFKHTTWDRRGLALEWERILDACLSLDEINNTEHLELTGKLFDAVMSGHTVIS